MAWLPFQKSITVNLKLRLKKVNKTGLRPFSSLQLKNWFNHPHIARSKKKGDHGIDATTLTSLTLTSLTVLPILLPFPLYQSNTLSLPNGVTSLVYFLTISREYRTIVFCNDMIFKAPLSVYHLDDLNSEQKC